MLVSVRKKHWLVLSVTVTGFLLLLAFNVKPPAMQPAKVIQGEAEIGFLRRRIANDDGEATGVGATPPPPDPPSEPSNADLKKELPPTTMPTAAIHLSAEERSSYAKQGILLVEGDALKENNNQIVQKPPKLDNFVQQQQPSNQGQQQPLQQPQQLQPLHQQDQQPLQQQNLQPLSQEELQPLLQQQPLHQQQLQPMYQENEQPSYKKDWQRQIMLQRQEVQKQQQLLQDQQLQNQQLHEQLDIVPPPISRQSSSKSVVSRKSQVSHETTRTHTAGRISGVRRLLPLTGHAQYPPVTYESLKTMGERILRHTIRRDFAGSVKDTDFTPGEIVPPSQVRRVLILSTWRSGSTFLGDILRSYPGTYFSFEPLHHLLKNLHLQDGPLVEVVTNLIRGIYTCDFSNQGEYVNYMRNNTFLIDHNTRIWNSCTRNQALCFDKTYLSNMCRFMPVNVMKTVRMGLSPAVQLLEDPNLDLRIIHLVRDPRGSLHSRMQLNWCKSKACSDPQTVCQDMLTDLNLSQQVKERFPDRYLFVRYEDLSLEPEKKAREIFSFLNLTYQKSVATFVKAHTSPVITKYKKKPGAYSTYRDSKATTFAWRGALNFTTVDSIQEVCQEPLQMLKLKSFRTEDDYLNATIPVLLA